MEELESEGKSVSEAVEAALKKLGLRRDQVEVQILQEASGGFLGMGSKPARVKITQKHWGEPTPGNLPPRPAPRPPVERRSQNVGPRRGQPERRREARYDVPPPKPVNRPTPAPKPAAKPAEKREERHEDRPAAAVDPQAAGREAETILKELLGKMGFEVGSIAVSWDAQQERVKAVLDSVDADKLVGSDGRALESLQFLATLLLSRKMGTPAAVQVDALGYWQKREADIMSQAERGIAEVKRTGKSFRLSPMDPAMRRLIHRNLASHPDVETASEGEGSWRKIVLRPRRK